MRILARITNLLLARVHGILKKKNLKLRKKPLGGYLIYLVMNKRKSVLKLHRDD